MGQHAEFDKLDTQFQLAEWELAKLLVLLCSGDLTHFLYFALFVTQQKHCKCICVLVWIAEALLP